MYPERARASGDEKREGWREVLYKQPFVCPDFCLWLTRALLQRGARGWASRTTSFSHCQPRPGEQKWTYPFQQETISSPRIRWEGVSSESKALTSRPGEEGTPCGITVSCCGAWAGWGEREGVGYQGCTGRRTGLLDPCLILHWAGRTDLTNNLMQ